MVMGVLYACAVLCALTLYSHAQWVHIDTEPGPQENEECDKRDGYVWFCKKDTECASARQVLRRGGSLRSCGWKDAKTHLICCPPRPSGNTRVKSVSERKCNMYRRRLCKGTVHKRSVDDYDVTPTAEHMEYVTATTLPPEIYPLMGGQEALRLVHPHMALIGCQEKDSVYYQCAGSLISERFVISAAHCTFSLAGPARWVLLGELDLASDYETKTQQFEIVERIVHPDYNSSEIYNDVVLFRLDRKVTFDEFVKPACLYQSTEDPEAIVVVTGWGQIEMGGPRSAKLLEAYLDILPVEECKRIFGIDPKRLARGIDTRTMLCASAPGKNTCSGDSGGPLVPLLEEGQCLAELAGITSFGGQCVEGGLPGVYVRVASFLPWIEAVVWPEEQKIKRKG